MEHVLTSLESVSREHTLRAKCLVAPNPRVGRQWLDRLALRGVPVVNWQIETPVGLARRAASPAQRCPGCRLAPGLLVNRLAQQMLARLREVGVVSQSPEGYAPALWRTVTQLRQAGVNIAMLEGGFWAHAMIAYDAALEEAKLFDVVDLWTWAREGLEASGGVFDGELVVLPRSVIASAPPVERRFWDMLDESSVVILPEVPEPSAVTGRYDQVRLGELAKGCDLSFHRALGTTMEVRRTFRECLSRGIALDEVELLYTRSDTYLPIIHEECLRTLGTSDAMTSLEGVPILFTRPARLIKRLCLWASEGYDQRGFESILLDGLLMLPEEVTRFEVASTVRRLPIGSGVERWREHVAEELAAIEVRRGEPDQASQGMYWDRQSRLFAGLQELLDRLFTHLSVFDQEGVPARELFVALSAILAEMANCPTQMDRLGRQRLADTFEQLATWHEVYPKSRDREGMLDEIAEVIDPLKVGALGPRSGRLFVAPLVQGGHTGRKYTFIVGMNDHAFPGSIRQDPLLTDRQRRLVNDRHDVALPLSGQNVREMIEGFEALLGRLEGEVQISFACHDMVNDRDLYPATVLLPLCAIHSGNPHAGLSDLDGLAGAPVAYLPGSPTEATTETFATLADASGRALTELWSRTCGHLTRGLRAAEARQDRAAFTPWDGNLSNGDVDHKVFSPSRLELLASCPRHYFFSHVLEIEPTDEFDVDADTWLDARMHGTLLHDVFCTFYRRVVKENLWNIPSTERRALLDEILVGQVDAIEAMCPAPNGGARTGLLRRARHACAILVSEDEAYMSATHCRPRALEVSVGLPVEDEGTDLDRDDPVELTDGLFIRGKIDRIDESTEAPGSLRLWDYKTGSTYAFRRNPPFDQGRKLQHYMYDRMVRAIVPGATVTQTGYFFPGTSGNGERIAYSPEELAGGQSLVGYLASLIRSGSYPATDDEGDCSYCPFRDICGDVQAVTEQSDAMLRACPDTKLDPMRGLRGVGRDDDE
jgi:RecB family exonuclease